MYNNIYTSEVKSSWLHACNIFAVVDVLQYIHKIISIPVLLYLKTTEERKKEKKHKERKILQNTFVGNIMSKMLKWILELLKSLTCIEDTKNSHTTIY